MIRPVGIDHLVLRVRSIDTAISFYCEVLGCEVERRRDELGLVHLRAGRSLIDLVSLDGKLGRLGGAAAGDEGRNVDHFCLRIEAFEPDALAKHLERAGLGHSDVQVNFGAEGEGPAIYVKDPDGNVIELKGPSAAVTGD